MVPLAASDVPAAPVLIFMGLGVLIATIGHASKSKSLVVSGLMMLFLATGAMFIGAYTAYEGGDERDPRPPCDETVKVCEKPDESPSERPREDP